MVLLIRYPEVLSIQTGIIISRTTKHQQITKEIVFLPGNYSERLLKIDNDSSIFRAATNKDCKKV